MFRVRVRFRVRVIRVLWRITRGESQPEADGSWALEVDREPVKGASAKGDRGGAVWGQHGPVYHARTIKGRTWIPRGQGHGIAAAPCSGWMTSLDPRQVQ